MVLTTELVDLNPEQIDLTTEHLDLNSVQVELRTEQAFYAAGLYY